MKVHKRGAGKRKEQKPKVRIQMRVQYFRETGSMVGGAGHRHLAAPLTARCDDFYRTTYQVRHHMIGSKGVVRMKRLIDFNTNIVNHVLYRWFLTGVMSESTGDGTTIWVV